MNSLSFIFISSFLLLLRLFYYKLCLNLYISIPFLILILILYTEWKRYRLPPGPIPIPFIGNMLSLIWGSFDETLLKWRYKYGEIFTIWIGPIPLVMVCSLSQMKRFFVDQAHIFSDRWRNHVTTTFMGGHYGIVQVDGQLWIEQRRFSLHLLRNFGVGRPQMEDSILNETQSLLSYLESSSSPINLFSPISICVGNVINKILFGKTFPQGSGEMDNLHLLLHKQSQLVVHPLMGLYITFPFTTNIPLINRPWKRLIQQRNSFWSFLNEQVEDHKTRFDIGSYEEDFTFSYLEEMRRRKEEEEGMGSFSEWQLRMLLLDLFFAGMETTVTTLKWAFLFMAQHPEIQEEVQRELDEISNEMIGLNDRKNLPYTNATICEIQRLANILPINLLRICNEDVIDGDIFYPKGTLIIPQISILLSDNTIWNDPDTFNPLRFLQDDRRTLKKIPHFIPFSIGKRQCLGESLAKAELFIIFTNVIKRFSIIKSSDISRDRPLGLTVSPKPYLVSIIKRSNDYNHNIIHK